MRSGEENPLDLNNLPEDYAKQVLDESSTTTAASTGDSFKEGVGLKKKKKEGKDESGKVYECRFCSLKFCKSQALGGHMNRHRQERETETLNRARELVFSTDNLPGAGPHMGLRDLCFGSTTAQPMLSPGANCFHQGGGGSGIGSDPRLHFRPLYPRHHLQNPPHAQPQYLYPTSPSTRPPPPAVGPYQQSTYGCAPAPRATPPLAGEYYIGRVLSAPGSSSNPLQALSQNYSGTFLGPSTSAAHNFSSSPEGGGSRPPFGLPTTSAGWVAGACTQRYGQHQGQHHEHGI